MPLTYADFVAVFPAFASDTPQGQSQVSGVIALAESELNADEWGSLYLSGLMNLVACRLTQMKAAAAQLSMYSSDTSQTTTPGSMYIKKYTVENEYSVEYDMTAIQQITKSIQSSGGSNGNNYYCEEYKRLQSLIGIGIIYSGESGMFNY